MTPRQYNELLRQAEVIERNKPHMEKMKVMNNKANKINDELVGIAIGTLSIVVITIVSYMALIIFG